MHSTYRKHVLLAAVTLGVAAAYNNGMARAPPLGWQTWCSAGRCGTDHCFDFQIKETAKAMKDNGMQALGFNWIVLDDCWHPSRNANGTLVPFPDFFPNGMKPVIDYVHSLGMKFGLYTSVGDVTCHGGWSPGSYGHYTEDADLFASWEVDYVKMDYCGHDDSPEGHKEFSAALNRTGRHMVLELCRGPYQGEKNWGYAPSIAQVWRATGDHHDSFGSTLDQLNAMKGKGTWSGPFGWAYGDMMMTGGQGCDPYDPKVPTHCPKQTDNEYRTEVSLYAVSSSPMMIGTDLRNMTSIMTETLLNKDVIFINQDYKSPPGDQVPMCPSSSDLSLEVCSVERQLSRHHCTLNESFGCFGNQSMWVSAGCRGEFECGAASGVVCNPMDNPGRTVCPCTAPPPTAWVRYLTDGRIAVGLPNLGGAAKTMDVCFSSLKMSSTKGVSVRDVWAQKDVGKFDDKYSAKVDVHDTLLLLLTPATQ